MKQSLASRGRYAPPNAMLPTNIFYRTFFIRAGQYGTCFTLDVDGSELIITAAHLLAEYKERQVIQLFHRGKWHSLDCRLVAAGRGDLDIAVLSTSTRLTDRKFTVGANFGNCFVGQDVFFVGFPYKMWVDYGEALDGKPGAFLKKGTLSAVEPGPPKTLYIDAINNEGFSGAPLYFFPDNDLKNPCIGGVVSKYKIEHETVRRKTGEATDMEVPYNTGFLVAYDIAHALELARKGLQ